MRLGRGGWERASKVPWFDLAEQPWVPQTAPATTAAITAAEHTATTKETGTETLPKIESDATAGLLAKGAAW